MSDSKKFKEKILRIFTAEDLFHKAFLRPLQVILRTKIVDPSYYQDKVDNGLPQGLLIAQKERGEMKNNIYTPNPINSVEIGYQSTYTYEGLVNKNEDNLLSLLKKQKGIQLAICVCMYSQDKKMLKTTLAGIGQNIDSLVNGGMDPDKIAVVVIMDGIQNVNETVVEYFQDLQRESQIYLNQDAPEPGDIFEQQKQQQLHQDDSELRKRNYFLFNYAQLQLRRNNRFVNRKKQFQQIKELKKQIKKLLQKKKAITYDSLNPRLQQFFVKNARTQYKQDFGYDDQEINKIPQAKFVSYYSQQLSKSRLIIQAALRQAKRYCDQYDSSRNQLAYVNCFRTGVFLEQEAHLEYSKVPDYKERKKQKKQDYLNINEQVETLTKIKMNLFMCVKYKNSGKLSSHNWFFNGFCHKEILNPKYAILMDVGLRPSKQAIYKMYHYMKQNPNVGGVCGYMRLKLQRVEDQQQVSEDLIDCLTKISLKFADIQRAQQIEYHFAHLIDKPFQSIFRFIHVLPGAFSGYNMNALIPDIDIKNSNSQLLKNYFSSLDDKMKQRTPIISQFGVGKAIAKVILPNMIYNCCYEPKQNSQEQLLYNENINLAEDRILCMGIHKNGKDLAFLPDAEAYVDPIKNIHSLFGQRKRWINGSYFAFQKVKMEIGKGSGCQICLHLQIVYLSFMSMLSFLTPAFFLFTVSVALQAFRADVIVHFLSNIIPQDSEIYNAFVLTIDFIYVLLFMGMVFFSLHLTNKNPKFIPYLYACSTIFGMFSIMVFVVLIVDIIRGLIGDSSFTIDNQKFIQSIPGGSITIDSLRYVIILIIGLYILPIIVYMITFCKFNFVVEIIFSVFSFIFYMPTYLILLNTYAICRIDDISWGTKGLDADLNSKDAKLRQAWKITKFLHVVKYVFWNIVVGGLLLHFGNDFTIRFFITFGIMIILAVTLLVKVFLASMYYFGYMCSRVKRSPNKNQKNITSKLLEQFKSFETTIKKNIEQNLDQYIGQYQKTYPNVKLNMASFIFAPKNKKLVQQYSQQSKIISKNRSTIQRKVDRNSHSKQSNYIDSESANNIKKISFLQGLIQQQPQKQAKQKKFQQKPKF